MKKIILGIVLLSSFLCAKSFQYLLYATATEMQNGKVVSVSAINDGKNFGLGSVDAKEKNSIQKANIKALEKYMKKTTKFKKAHLIEIINILGNNGWEMVSNTKSNNNLDTYIFKKEL
ncbi:hypothetical protein CPG37_08915 [Malaciobacter canalis]|uniref:DUF1318 domain-containing protein n=1 Tax=Malaciobacter canalis TaxID=1912871 RepID=A0ABX4LNY8_9BACT|nr:hypothetical protein [Malaciobacter canalis]PHO09611.1 hypothetical protein CPG37_08915 [Malaciobacter canalis]QEE31680.1 hypothetical protein ACAN_0144 [Malaciobacter canalis]